MKKILISSFYQMFCVWKALVTNWWPGVYLVQRYLPGAICIQCHHAGLVCAYEKQPKICMKWGQRNWSKNVNDKRPFSRSDRGPVQPGQRHCHTCCHPILTDQLADCTQGWHGVAAQLREPCTQTGARAAPAGPVADLLDIEPGFRTVLL